MPAISYSSVTKRYGQAGAAAVYDVTLDVDDAKFVVLLGPSGCGKTTLLKMTNRLIEPTGGRIDVNGRDITSVKATELRRHIGYVIQQVGLFPHMTVEANIATVPRLLGWSRSRTDGRIDELLNLVGLAPDQYRRRYPQQLSGGQQQRVGLARAMAVDPPIMLMDEPFGAIDAITRSRLQDQLVQIQRKVRKTVLFVTHDVDEALRLGDMLVIMREGAVVQYDTPFNILTRPRDDFIRELLDTDDILRELSLVTVDMAMAVPNGRVPVVTIGPHGSLRQALSLMIATGESHLSVVNEDGLTVGLVTLDQIREYGNRSKQPDNEWGPVSVA